jgi:hypothetical protein
LKFDESNGAVTRPMARRRRFSLGGMQQMKDDDWFAFGLRAAMQGGYWISGEVPAPTLDLGNGNIDVAS